MASPHAVGVMALIESETGTRHDFFRAASILQRTATDIACPSAAVLAEYAPFPSVNNDAPQTCQGSAQHNSWYGFGEVNALQAVLHRADRDYATGLVSAPPAEFV